MEYIAFNALHHRINYLLMHPEFAEENRIHILLKSRCVICMQNEWSKRASSDCEGVLRVCVCHAEEEEDNADDE